jgi:hypothetical protein
MKRTTIKKSASTIRKSQKRIDDVPLPTILVGEEGRDYTISPIERSGGPLYRIECNECINFIQDVYQYVVFYQHGRYIMFPVTGTEVPEALMERCAVKLAKVGNRSNLQLFKRVVFLQTCGHHTDLTDAQNALLECNRLLKLSCPQLHLSVDHYYRYPVNTPRFTSYSVQKQYYDTILLCLCTKETDQCVSSIELNVSDEGAMEIQSKTIPSEENKKYNKLLRSVVSLVASQIPGIHWLKSVAVNPKSAWLLLKYFHATMDKESTLPMKTQEDIIEYFRTHTFLYLSVHLTDENNEQSYQEFLTTLPTITCTKVLLSSSPLRHAHSSNVF